MYYNKLKIMNILIKVSPSVIYLKGDKEVEAVTNYMWNKHHVDISIKYDSTKLRNFACNFLMKYNADVVLYKLNDTMFYYVKFN